MSNIILYMYPGSCSRVTTIALEELGLTFEARPVRVLKGDHKSPQYKEYNPKGKIPVLIIDGEALTENVAIISYLNERHGGLLPAAEDALSKARQLADLCFCSSTLHPLVSRIRMPHLFAGEDVAETVWARGGASMDEYFQLIENRLDQQPWWYGDEWSMMDAYLFWCFWRVEGAGYDVSRYPNFTAHARRMEARPSVKRAMAGEQAAEATLKAEGMLYTPSNITQT